MALSLQLYAKPLQAGSHVSPFATNNSIYKKPRRTNLCSVATVAAAGKSYFITLLPGDGIGPEVITVAKNVLTLTASLQGIEFKFREMPVGGAALDSVGVPFP